MNIGDKIRYFRTAHKMTAETLAELSGINISTIRKYEQGDRNPKPDQLLKIAEALGVSINTFMDFDIKTVSDLLTLIFKMDEQLPLSLEAEKDESGAYDYRTLKLSFQSDIINQKLLTYMMALRKRSQYLAERDQSIPMENDETLLSIENNIADLRNRLVDDSTIIQKDTDPATSADTSPPAGDSLDAFQSQELNSMLHDVLFDCSANELELIIRTAQTIKDCLRKQAK